MISRLQRNYDKRSQRQVALFIVGSLVSVVLLVVYGIPFLFSLTGAISNLGHKTTITNTGNTVAPTTPEFSQNLQATFSASIKISGVADPKTTVEIFKNGTTLGTVISGDDGAFTQDVDLDKGLNTFTAIAINEAGQKSTNSDPYSISLITGKPKLDISSPKDGDTTNNSPYNIIGQTDPGDSVSINDRLAIVGKDGKFNYSASLNDGDNKFKIITTDPAGNQTSKDLTLKYQK